MKNNKNFISSKQTNRRLFLQPSAAGAVFAVSILAFSLFITLFGTFAGSTTQAEIFAPLVNPAMSLVTADLSVNITDAPDPVAPGGNLSYPIAINNAGPESATDVVLTTQVPANTTFVSLTQPSAFQFTCTTPAVGGTGGISCTAPTFINGTVLLVLTVNVNANTPNGTIITNSAAVASTSSDPVAGNNSAMTTTTVSRASDSEPTPTPTPTNGFTRHRRRIQHRHRRRRRRR